MEDAEQTNTFSEEGRIHQVEYAIKSVSSAGSALGLVFKDGVFLLGRVTDGNTLIQDEKIYRINATTYTVLGGLYADSNLLVNYARIKAQEHLHRYNEEMSPFGVARVLSRIVQGFTQQGGMRPFGVSFLVAGWNAEREYEMYSVDPSGSQLRWSAYAFGEGDKTISTGLEEHSPGCEMDEAVTLGVKAISSSSEGAGNPDMLVCVVMRHLNGVAEVRHLSREEIRGYLEKVKK